MRRAAELGDLLEEAGLGHEVKARRGANSSTWTPARVTSSTQATRSPS
jgi:hypothetical protein